MHRLGFWQEFNPLIIHQFIIVEEHVLTLFIGATLSTLNNITWNVLRILGRDCSRVQMIILLLNEWSHQAELDYSTYRTIISDPRFCSLYVLPLSLTFAELYNKYRPALARSKTGCFFRQGIDSQSCLRKTRVDVIYLFRKKAKEFLKRHGDVVPSAIWSHVWPVCQTRRETSKFPCLQGAFHFFLSWNSRAFLQ